MEKVNRLIFLEKSPPEAKDLPWFTVYYFTANSLEVQLTADGEQHEQGVCEGFPNHATDKCRGGLKTRGFCSY